jgi:hypothetical protein
MVFTLGAPGAQGPAGTIAVGTVTASAPGAPAVIVNVGTPTAAILDFTIPRGEQGTQGIQGIQGIQGVQGVQGVQGEKGDKGDQGIPGTSGVAFATAPLSYDSGTQTVSISPNPNFDSISIATGGYAGLFQNQVFIGDGILTNYLDMTQGLVLQNGSITFPDSTVQTTAFPGFAGYALESWVTAGFAVKSAGQPVSGTVGQVLTKNSGTNYDSSWTTLIPGDRYLTTSTTSLQINNQTKTLTIGTGLSYTSQQDVVIAYDADHHMHARVLTYNSATGVMTVDVLSHSGTGTFALWTVNVGGAVPAQSVAWGSITGTLGNQADLATALNAKLSTVDAAATYYPLTNPTGFITSAALTPYLTTATAASTYFTIASAAGKANLSGATFTGKVNLATISASSPSVNLGGQCDSAPASATNGDLWISNAASPKLTYRTNGINYNLAVLNQFNTFTGQMVINTTSSSTAALRVTQLGAGNAIEVEDSTSPDSTRFVVDANGKVGIGVVPDTNAALKVDTNGIMFGDGTTQTTAAVPPTPPTPPSPIIAFANTIASQITSLTWNLNSDGATASIQFVFNLNNASVIERMRESSGQNAYISCTFDNGFGYQQTVWCLISSPLTSVTTTDFSESFQYSIGLNGTVRVKLGNEQGYDFYDITL